MVSWGGDGLIAGFDPITHKLKDGLYHFASPGAVDLGGITRISYPMGAGLSAATYPNRLKATAPFTFTAGDYAANPGKVFCAAMYITDSANFPAGHVPTASEILALGDSKVSVYRSSDYLSSGAVTHTFTIPGPAGLAVNIKYWVLILPTAMRAHDVTYPWNLHNDQPMAGITINTFGRALSLWTGRTPAAPVITSPVDGSIHVPGSTFNITINPQDPDEVSPEDATKFNDDINGLQIQYAPLPSVDNPTPTWTDLPYDVNLPGIGPYRISAWHIRGSRYINGLAGLPELESLVANLGCPVVSAAGDAVADYQPGKGAIPSGDWQIRVRTFDYGHPYPNLGTSTTQPGPLGINPATTQLLEPAKDSYPASNTSPWSAPVKITIPAQVPPPIPTYPTDELAVPEGETVRLRWKYRNTHLPPRDQYRRAVQIRPVSGNNDWSTIFDGYSSDAFVDLPPTLVQTPVPPMEMLADGGFEGGTVDGWTALVGTTALTNVNSPANAHSGNRYLQVVTTGSPEAQFSKTVTPPPEYERAKFNIWFYVDLAGVGPTGIMQFAWLDSLGSPIMPDGSLTSGVFYKFDLFTPSVNGWNNLIIDDTTLGEIHRPPGGVDLRISIIMDGTVGTDPYTFRFDDGSLVAYGPDLDDFSMSATTEYEWRVQTTDTDGEESNYSSAARFWVVPGAGSGEVRPVPGETIDGATLGCGHNRVFVYRRGGEVRVGEITNVSHVDWGRKRDDGSTAQVEVSGWDIDCGNLLSLLQTWAYELVIFRDNGYSVDRVWEGPITLLTFESDKVTIDAKDAMGGYAYRRIIKQAMNDFGSTSLTAGTTVVDRARRVLQNVFAPDDPNVLAYLQVLSRDDDAKQYRSLPAYSRTAFEEIDDMAANAGLDYTVVGRSILLWGTKHRIGTLPEFKDEDLGASPVVSEYGMSFANRYAVSDGNGVYGEATRLTDGQDPVYGLVEMLSSTWATDSENESGTYTQEGLATTIASFKEFSERSIADRNPPPEIVRIPDNTTLNPGTVISIQNLVPGVALPLRSTSTLRKVTATQKLDSVKVVEENGVETVSITLSPFSRDDGSMTDGGEGDA
jgi:hypothetical protein